MRHPHSSARLRPGASLGAIGRLFACVAFLAISGCGLLPDVVDETTNLNAEQMYKLAHDALTSGNYTRAVKLFESLEARFLAEAARNGVLFKRGAYNYAAIAHDEQAIADIEAAASAALVTLRELSSQ